MNLKAVRVVHLIGIGGINMSAVAKLLLASGVRVSGSDVAENEQTMLLKAQGVDIKIGEAPEHVPADCELIIYTSAAPVTNKERIAAATRQLPQMTNFAFLGQWFTAAKTYVVSGTHGKSTTTAMLGLMLESAGLNPTVVVGSKVPGFPDGNVRLGREDLFVVEGDEYARHFLEFHPDGVILNNLELDHTDIFHSIDSLLASFHELVSQVRDQGVIVANISDQRILRLIETERVTLEARGIRIISFETATGSVPAREDSWIVRSSQKGDDRVVEAKKGQETFECRLAVPGHFNALNAVAAALLAQEMGVRFEDGKKALEGFKGIWRRFEFLGEVNEARVYSDYGHHPTAVVQTLKAAHESFPDRRILLCFQPHHRNRTKSLFLDFVPSFDLADEVVVCEIYDVAGRNAKEDEDISSHDVVDAVTRHDADRGVKRVSEYAATPEAAVRRILEMSKPDDIVICMGAGDIDTAIRKTLGVS